MTDWYHRLISFVFAALITVSTVATETSPLNILLFTADDLGYEVMSDPLDVTPNLDKFAREGIRFNRAHMNMPICQPSRGIIATGRYGQTTGMMGFFHLREPVPTVMQTLRDHGYATGVLGKVKHSTPDENYQWDYAQDYRELGAGRDPEKYHTYSVEFFNQCKKADKPFYFMVNSHDPHRPFHDPERPKAAAAKPSKLFKPSDIRVPSYLPDLPGVRREISHYYNSVRRLDDTFGRVMDALDESGLAQNTLVMFVSDNGSAFPFAKANAYVPSTLTPCYMRWPGKIEPGSVDKKHFVSSIDFLPTFLEAAGVPVPKGVDGRSMVPLMRGESMEGRDVVFTQIDYKIGGPASPMRAIENERYRYIFNPWAGEDYRYRNNNEGETMRAMEAAADTNIAIAERVRVYRHRDLEEFFDLTSDPDCIHNLVHSPEAKTQVDAMRLQLEEWMKKTGDPLLPAFAARNSSLQMKEALEKHYPKKTDLRTDQQKAKDKARPE
ncbi:MAG: sulfatase [Planctomycetota bacterium]